MNSTTLYKENRRQLIARFNGAEEGILSLEKTIESRPQFTRAIREINGYAIYEKSASVTIFDRLMYSKYNITICYVVHIETNVIILNNIY